MVEAIYKELEIETEHKMENWLQSLLFENRTMALSDWNQCT